MQSPKESHGDKVNRLAAIQSYAIAKGGVCLSAEYLPNPQKMLFECSKGHQWGATADQIINRGSWCRKCADNLLRHPLSRQSELLERAKKYAISRGGVCLSQEYKTARLPLHWECNHGHRWDASADNVVRGGRWCPYCGHTVTAQKKLKFSLDACIALGEEYGVKCVSKEKPTNLKQYSWECSKGHVFNISPAVGIKNKFTCPKCKTVRHSELKVSGELPEHKTQYAICIDIARKNGGDCLSSAYLGANKKLLWVCALGHKWEAIPGSIKAGTWCPICAGRQRLTIQDAQILAIKKGGRCLSSEYKNARTGLIWECSQGHQWTAKFDSVKRSTWCPICSAKLQGEKTLKYTPEELELIAQSRGGHFLSEIYRGALVRHKWSCVRGHVWMATPSSVVNKGTWCSSCSRYLSERICNIAIEKITGKRFVKGRPLWLRSPNDTQMEFDGYCEEIGVAWEHHGLQHYKDITAFKSKMSLEQRKSYDERKRKLAHSHNIVLIEIPQLTILLSIEDLSDFIVNQLRENNKAEYIVYEGLIDYSSAYILDDRIEELYKIAKSRGGRCLTNTYLGARYRYLWECSEGHQWNQTSDAVKRGTWCPYCSGRHNITIKTARDYAKQNGGQLLSTSYKNSSTPLDWKCERGHVFTLSMGVARATGRFCSICSKIPREK